MLNLILSSILWVISIYCCSFSCHTILYLKNICLSLRVITFDCYSSVNIFYRRPFPTFVVLILPTILSKSMKRNLLLQTFFLVWIFMKFLHLYHIFSMNVNDLQKLTVIRKLNNLLTVSYKLKVQYFQKTHGKRISYIKNE